VTDRARQIIAVARELVERDGADALTMRRLADAVGIKAPSLYKHFPDKSAVETALIGLALDEMAVALETAEAGFPGSLPDLAAAYRRYALAHPHLYRLAHDRPLDRATLPEGVEDRASAPLFRAAGGDENVARATWAFAHGMIVLELNHRFPPGTDLSLAWATGADAFSAGPRR
jgi:AcrR family transcriptional regulator